MLAVFILGLQDDSKYELLDRSNCDFIHLDIMDGLFVNNKKEYTSNYKFNKPLDVHLMVNDVLDYIDKYLYLNPYRISFHIETNIDIKEAISKLKSSNIKVGLAINDEMMFLEYFTKFGYKAKNLYDIPYDKIKYISVYKFFNIVYIKVSFVNQKRFEQLKIMYSLNVLGLRKSKQKENGKAIYDKLVEVQKVIDKGDF